LGTKYFADLGDRSRPELRQRRRLAGLPGSRRTVEISAARLSEIIGDIYECILNPKRWEVALASINREFSFANSVLGILPFRPGGQVVNVSVGFDPEWLAIAGDDTYRAESVALWGGGSAYISFLSTSRSSTRRRLALRQKTETGISTRSWSREDSLTRRCSPLRTGRR
jgi:hypothetical protein